MLDTGTSPSTTRHLTSAAITQMVRWSRRSWWAALYRDGTQLFEWGTLMTAPLTPLGLGRTSRWEEVEKDGMVSLRLLAPNGQIGELWGEPHHFFQLKVGVWIAGEASSQAHAHLIGVVEQADGFSQCIAWEPRRGALIQFGDNVYGLQYHGIGPLAHEVQGLRL